MSLYAPSPWEGFVYYTQSLAALWPEKAVISSFLTGAVILFGGDAFIMWLLIGVMGADFVFGFAEAARRKHIRCRAMGRGVLKFVYYVSYIGLVGVVNVSLSRSFGIHVPLLDMFMSYLIITDTISVMAHMQRLGIPVPALLQRIVVRSRDKIERGVSETLDEDKQ